MKENRNAVYVTLILSIISLALSILLTYVWKMPEYMNQDFIVDCLLGVFTGAILSLIIAIINYNVLKRQAIAEFVSFINAFNVSIVPMFYLFKDAERNVEIEIEMINKWNDFLLQNYHMQINKIHLFNEKSKLAKKIDEISDMITELYILICETNNYIKQYEFRIISLDELDKQLIKLFMYMRNYKDTNDFFTNILSIKQDELQKLADLEYNKVQKMVIK